MTTAPVVAPSPGAANPRRRTPARYRVAAAIGAAVFIALVASSALDYLSLDRIPYRGGLLALPAAALLAAAAWVAVRALERGPDRRRHQLWAAALGATALLLWLLVLDAFLFTAEAGPVAAAVAAVACLPTTAFGLWVVHRLDPHRQEPWRLVLVSAIWGAVIATALVIWAESLWDSWSLHALVPGPGLDASRAFSAGLFEELAKGVAVILLFLVMRDRFHDVVDGIVLGAAVGLGFNFMETIGYVTYLDAIFGPVAAAFQWYHRQVLDLFFGHAAYTALMGAGVGVARQLHGRRRQALAIASGWLAAIGAHFAWDAWLTFFPLGTGLLTLVNIHLRVLVMSGPFLAAVLVLLFLGRRLEGRALARQFELEAAMGLGTVLPIEVAILSNPAYRVRARVAAGPRYYAKIGRLQRAQLELALERWHRERQEIDTPLSAEEELRARVLAARADLMSS